MNEKHEHTTPRREAQIVIVQSYLPNQTGSRWAHVAVRGCSGVVAIKAAKECISRRWHIPAKDLRAPFIHPYN